MSAPTKQFVRHYVEMVIAVVALLWTGLVADLGILLGIEHVAMLASMLAAMLLRRAEYSHGTHRRRRVAQVAA